MSRLTKKITYSLTDRGYQHNGEDRNNLDIKATINLIRSPQIQELVNKGAILGYYGHQIRQLFGLNPPETAIIDGKEIRIEPAVKTTFLAVDNDGNITHQQYFFENDAGEHAYRQYKAGIGGFSSAFYSPYHNGRRVPEGFFGYDFVLRPNYDDNRGFGMFDSLDGTANDLQKQYLESSIMQMYDHIHQSVANYHISDFYKSQAQTFELALQKVLQRQEKRKQRMKEKQLQKEQQAQDEHLACLLDSMSLDDFLHRADGFLSASFDSPAIQEKPTDHKKISISEKLFNLLG